MQGRVEDIFSGFDWGGLTLLNAEHHIITYRDYFIKDTVSTEFYQLGAKFCGDTLVSYNGKTYSYTAGTVLYLPKESRRDIVYNRHIREPGEGVYIFFDSPKRLFDKPVTLPFANNPQIKELFLKTANQHLRDDQLSYMESFYRLLSKLRDETQKQSDNRGIRSRLSPAVDYIAAHLCDEYIDLAKLAGLCAMTPDYFRHCFGRVFRVSPLQYINHQKANLAKKMLNDERLGISEIAKSLGFSSGSYFARFFREHTGLSPTQYRELCRNMI